MARCDSSTNHLFIINEIEERGDDTTADMEDVERRKRVRRVTNIFSFIVLMDAVISFALHILNLQAQHFEEIAALLACMQMACFLFLSLTVAWFTLRSKTFEDRIDALGAWVVVHFVNLISNVCLVVFQLIPEPMKIVEAPFMLIILIIWKILFTLVEIISMLYCFYITHKPITYLKESRVRHPLFPDELNPSNTTNDDTVTTNVDNINAHQLQERNVVQQRPISLISTGSQFNNNRYDSYLSLTQTGDTKFVRNPCYESELSLHYANNYSPYDNMMSANRSRLSYVERFPQVLPAEIDNNTARHRPYLHNGVMSNRNSYISSNESEFQTSTNTSKRFNSGNNPSYEV